MLLTSRCKGYVAVLDIVDSNVVDTNVVDTNFVDTNIVIDVPNVVITF
jgi:hypothetical protein